MCCARLITFFDQWSDENLIAKWIIDILFNQNIVSKLEQQIESKWSPTTDRIAIHLWIHPWLPKLRTQELESSVFRPIRKKISNALKQWNPLDQTALIFLRPWRHVFGSKNWHAFIKENIIPKLEEMMANLVVVHSKVPTENDLKQLKSLLAWQDMANEKELISILRQHFFPKWLKVLYNWLDKQPNFSEIKQWYLKWRSQFPFEWFSKELVVCQGFTIALRMIEFCIDNKAVADAQMASFQFIL